MRLAINCCLVFLFAMLSAQRASSQCHWVPPHYKVVKIKCSAGQPGILAFDWIVSYDRFWGSFVLIEGFSTVGSYGRIKSYGGDNKGDLFAYKNPAAFTVLARITRVSAGGLTVLPYLSSRWVTRASR
jgi:hypothetical protein